MFIGAGQARESISRDCPTGDSGTSVGMEFDDAFFGPSGTVPVELQSFAID